jgi:hypothetical protein
LECGPKAATHGAVCSGFSGYREIRITDATFELEPFCKPATAQNRARTPVLRQPGEDAPIGLILCAESSREQVELLQMHKDGITVAEYWTELPPKAELVQKLHAALLEARERLARRSVLLGAWMMSNDHESQQRPGVPLGGPVRLGPHARQGQRRTRGRAGVLCGGDTGYAAVSVGRERGRRLGSTIALQTVNYRDTD